MGLEDQSVSEVQAGAQEREEQDGSPKLRPDDHGPGGRRVTLHRYVIHILFGLTGSGRRPMFAGLAIRFLTARSSSLSLTAFRRGI